MILPQTENLTLKAVPCVLDHHMAYRVYDRWVGVRVLCFRVLQQNIYHGCFLFHVSNNACICSTQTHTNHNIQGSHKHDIWKEMPLGEHDFSRTTAFDMSGRQMRVCVCISEDNIFHHKCSLEGKGNLFQ